MCKVDGDSCVNTPVVIFVEQMSIAQNTILAELLFERKNRFSECFYGNSCNGEGFIFFPITKSKNVFATSPIATLSYKPSIINIMPFNTAQLTAFWTSPDQMGLSARTRTQMALEGLATPANFEDFSERSDLDALVKLLLNQPRSLVGLLVTCRTLSHMRSLPSRRFGLMGPVRWYYTTF